MHGSNWRSTLKHKCDIDGLVDSSMAHGATSTVQPVLLVIERRQGSPGSANVGPSLALSVDMQVFMCKFT